MNSLAIEVQKSVTYVGLRGCEVQEDRIGSKFVFYVLYYIMTWSDLLLLLLLQANTQQLTGEELQGEQSYRFV